MKDGNRREQEVEKMENGDTESDHQTETGKKKQADQGKITTQESISLTTNKLADCRALAAFFPPCVCHQWIFGGGVKLSLERQVLLTSQTDKLVALLSADQEQVGSTSRWHDSHSAPQSGAHSLPRKHADPGLRLLAQQLHTQQNRTSPKRLLMGFFLKHHHPTPTATLYWTYLNFQASKDYFLSEQLADTSETSMRVHHQLLPWMSEAISH